MAGLGDLMELQVTPVRHGHGYGNLKGSIPREGERQD